MDAENWEISTFFLHLTKKTGLQVHPTTDMQFTESREEEKTEPSDTQRSSSLSFCYGLTSAGRTCWVSVGGNRETGKWKAGMDKYIDIYWHIEAKVEITKVYLLKHWS